MTIEANKRVVLALATALIDHPERTLDGVEIDRCIADTLNRETQQAEIKRRAKWAMILANTTNSSAALES